MWQGLLALKNDQAAVQMYFVSGNESVAKYSLPKNIDGSTPPLRIFQRMRLEPPQVEGVARKMQVCDCRKSYLIFCNDNFCGFRWKMNIVCYLRYHVDTTIWMF